MRKVLIGTPSYAGQLDVWYTNSLCNTIKMSAEHGVEIIPMWVSFDALLQRARNDTVQIAMDLQVDDLFWIDADIEWKPEWFYKILDRPEDVVGGTYRKKGDKEEYVVRQIERKPPDPHSGLIEVEGLGTGFVKMSKAAFTHLWDVSKVYMDPKDMRERRMIFDVVIENQSLVSEDIHAFNKLRAGGFPAYLDPKVICNHIGPYKFQGTSENFMRWNRVSNLIKRQL